jgi:hypothetical protein
MKAVTSFTLNLAAAVLILLTSAGIAAAAAGTDTCAGKDALFDDSCVTLTNSSSGNQANSAFGSFALLSNTTGGDNTAAGASALESNTTGSSNTAAGALALLDNTTGGENTATGVEALLSNTTGGGNTAAGAFALDSNSTGEDNTAAGASALESNTTGGSNIGIGAKAGLNLTTGDNNIDIGNQAVAGESNIIHIGTQGMQTSTFIAGIFGTTFPKSAKAVEVMIDSGGHLGTKGKGKVSSARYKRDIRDMGDASDGLLKLRPVSFRYKQDPTGALEYGLIAEEVERVYPELVTYGDDGKIEGVLYESLPALLLNEVQKVARENKRQADQTRTITAQVERKDARIASMQNQIASQQGQIEALKKKDTQIDALAERMNALERQARLARPEHLASAMR